MDDVQLSNWYYGIDSGPVEAYRIFDQMLYRALGVESGAVVWLSDYTLTKTKIKHKEIGFQDYLRMSEILAAGFVSPGNKKRSVEIVHAELSGSSYKFWRVCLKGTAKDSVFVSMFHRTKQKEARRLYRRSLKRGTLLRDHKEAPMRQLLSHTSAHV